jgi:hypothetical protein
VDLGPSGSHISESGEPTYLVVQFVPEAVELDVASAAQGWSPVIGAVTTGGAFMAPVVLVVPVAPDVVEPVVSLVDGWSPVIGAAPLALSAAAPVAPTASDPDRLLEPPLVCATAAPARLKATKAAVR